RIRVTAQLVNASNGLQLWSQTYEEQLDDVFAVQDEITRAISGALKLRLAGTKPPQRQNMEAYNLYLQGVFFLNKSTEEGLRLSLDFFRRSLEIDPNSARAWAGIARTWNWLADAYLKPSKAYPQMKAAAQKALAIDPQNAEAHIWLGVSKRVLDWDWGSFRTELDRALRLDPNSAMAHAYMSLNEEVQGNPEAVIAHVKESIRLDPLSPAISRYAALGYMYVGHMDEALVESRRTMQLDPNYIYKRPILAEVYR